MTMKPWSRSRLGTIRTRLRGPGSAARRCTGRSSRKRRPPVRAQRSQRRVELLTADVVEVGVDAVGERVLWWRLVIVERLDPERAQPLDLLRGPALPTTRRPLRRAIWPRRCRRRRRPPNVDGLALLHARRSSRGRPRRSALACRARRERSTAGRPTDRSSGAGRPRRRRAHTTRAGRCTQSPSASRWSREATTARPRRRRSTCRPRTAAT